MEVYKILLNTVCVNFILNSVALLLFNLQWRGTREMGEV